MHLYSLNILVFITHHRKKSNWISLNTCYDYLYTIHQSSLQSFHDFLQHLRTQELGGCIVHIKTLQIADRPSRSIYEPQSTARDKRPSNNYSWAAISIYHLLYSYCCCDRTSWPTRRHQQVNRFFHRRTNPCSNTTPTGSPGSCPASVLQKAPHALWQNQSQCQCTSSELTRCVHVKSMHQLSKSQKEFCPASPLLTVEAMNKSGTTSAVQGALLMEATRLAYTWTCPSTTSVFSHWPVWKTRPEISIKN